MSDRDKETIGLSEMSPAVIADALREARKMAVVGEMACGLAHDFNNSIQGAMLALDLIGSHIENGRPKDSQSLLTHALNALQRASALSNRLLHFAVPQGTDRKPIDVNAVIVGIEGLLKSMLGGAVKLEMALADDLAPALCDAHGLENALLNLAINARDAMPAGGRLTIATGRVDGTLPLARPAFCIRVSDTGIGMDTAVVKQAFQAFFTTKPAGRGTGLGLAMVRDFVASHGGHCEIASAPGFGTTVSLHLLSMVASSPDMGPNEGAPGPVVAPVLEP